MSTEKQERATVRRLCEESLKVGYWPIRVEDNEGDRERVVSIQHTVNEATARELATIIFKNADYGDEFTAVYVNGNGYECIVDFSYDKNAEDLIDQICEGLYAFIGQHEES